MRRFAFLQVLVMAALALYGLIACGGSGQTGEISTSGKGRLTLSITWPSSRAIPAETRSIRVTAKVLQPADGPEVANEVVQRPEGQSTTEVVLDNIPSVKVLVTASAYASNDGTGDVIASGSKEVTVPENNSVAANIELTGDEPSDGCPFFMARFGSNTATSIGSIASVSGAYAAHENVFATIFNAGSAEAHSDSLFKIEAPNISGPFSITLELRSRIEDEQESPNAHAGSITYTYPTGVHTLSHFTEPGEQEIVTRTIQVQHDQVLRLDIDLQISSGPDTGVTAIGDLAFTNLPTGVFVNEIICEDE
jgi:hypothetical protein